MILDKLLGVREESLSLPIVYGKVTEVAKKPLEFIPTGTGMLEDLGLAHCTIISLVAVSVPLCKN